MFFVIIFYIVFSLRKKSTPTPVKTPEQLAIEANAAAIDDDKRVKRQADEEEVRLKAVEEEQQKIAAENIAYENARKLKNETLALATSTSQKLYQIIDDNFTQELIDSMYIPYSTMIREQLRPALAELFSKTKNDLGELSNKYNLGDKYNLAFLNIIREMNDLEFYSTNLKRQIAFKLNEVKSAYKTELSKPLYAKIRELADQLVTERYGDPPASLSSSDARQYIRQRLAGGNLSQFSKKRRNQEKNDVLQRKVKRS